MSTACENCERTSPAVRDPVGPAHDQRRPRAAEPRVPLPEPERGVAGPGPAPRVVVVEAVAAELLALVEHVAHRLLGPQRERVLVERAVRATLGARAVVGHDHDQGVLAQAELLHGLHDPPDLRVDVRHDAGVDLVHAGVQRALVGGELVPRPDPRGARREGRSRRHDAELRLAREDSVAHGVPAVVELAAVAVAPLGRDVVRGVRRGRREVQEERAVWARLVLVADHLDRLAGEVLAEVVAVADVRPETGWRGCRPPATATTGWPPRRGSRSSARTPARAASG